MYAQLDPCHYFIDIITKLHPVLWSGCGCAWYACRHFIKLCPVRRLQSCSRSCALCHIGPTDYYTILLFTSLQITTDHTSLRPSLGSCRQRLTKRPCRPRFSGSCPRLRAVRGYNRWRGGISGTSLGPSGTSLPWPSNGIINDAFVSHILVDTKLFIGLVQDLVGQLGPHIGTWRKGCFGSIWDWFTKMTRS
jgi:hypothetical protein